MRLKALHSKKFSKTLLLALFLSASTFLIAPHAMASFGDWAGEVVGGIIGILISALGLILILVIKGLMLIATYQHFIDSQAVKEGWSIVRDLSNMFFVVILLVIAFSSILHLENFSYKKWLPKLILMAVLINFSKTICGLMIDVAQIIMLTFVNAFKDIAGGNFIDMLGIKSIVTMANDSDNVGFWTIVGAYVLGLIYMVIALVVITTMLMMLTMRLVMIWIYVVLSPLAYLLAAFPGGASYASQWWSEFVKNLIVGPMIAFFIWLSFAALQTGAEMDIVQTAANTTGAMATEADNTLNYEYGDDPGKPVASSEASTPGALVKFIIGIGMLIGGLKISQQIGGEAGSMAGKGMGKISKLGAVAAGGVGGFALARAKWAGRQGLGAVAKTTQGAGKILGGNSTMVGRGLGKVGDIGMSWRSDLIAANKKKKVDSRKKFLEKIGVDSGTADKINQTFGKSRNAQFGANAVNATAAGGVVGASMGAAFGSALGPLGALLGAGMGLGFAKVVKKAAEVKDANMGASNVTAAQADVTAKETAVTTALAAAGGNAKDPAVVAAKKELKESKSKLKFAEGKGLKGGVVSGLASLSGFSTEYTSAAAKKIAEVENKARQKISSLANDPTFMNDASAGIAYSSDGQKEDQEAFIRHLSDDTPEAAAARANMENWVRTGVSSDKDKNVLRSLAKGIAATNKKGEVDTSSLAAIVAAINAHVPADLDSTVAGFEPGVISYRQSGVVGEKGTGGMYVNTFAQNKEGKDVLGADFQKLKQQGFKIDAKADGVFIPAGNQMAAVAKALVAQIQGAKLDLERDHDSGKIDDEQYIKSKSDLDKAEQRLQKPESLQGLSIINTKSANFGREARLTTAYHEQIHQGGIKDEALTEGIAKALMAQKLYGRNAATGGRHVNEIAAKAKQMKDGGSSNADILKMVNQEASQRSAAESKSRAERVVQMESGKRETETDFVASSVAGSNVEVNIDTKTLETKLDSLQKSFKSLKLPADNSSKMAQWFAALNTTIRKTSGNTARAIDKMPVAEASTPLEVELMADTIK